MLAAVNVLAQSSVIRGPMLGFTTDSAGSMLWPIIGIPGASSVADALDLNTNIREAVISPKQDYALAVRTEDSQVILVDLKDGTARINPLESIHADLIAISPTGSAAALCDRRARSIQVIGRVPQLPEVTYRFDTSSIPGDETALAVSDDGTTALVRFADGDSASLWVFNTSGALLRIAADRPAAAAFLPNRLDAIVTDDAERSAFMVTDVNRSLSRIPLISAVDGINTFSSVAASDDGRRAFIADGDSGTIAIIDIETGISTTVACDCAITGLHRLNGFSTFRLTEASQEPMVVLDASSTEPRIVLIPPSTSLAR